MRRYVFLTCAIVLAFSNAAFSATISRSTEDQLKQVEQRAAKAAESNVAEYAREWLDAATASITAAKANVAVGREKEALQKMELAETQLKAADAKASEKEVVEKVALRRAELKKMEAQLERYRQGEAN
ncbi:MAG: hypothetical protein HY888_10600 [Deltaproteobacteria bacterium]|nr:hypothetical protein [Deltaproteobacteria bacterium]